MPLNPDKQAELQVLNGIPPHEQSVPQRVRHFELRHGDDGVNVHGQIIFGDGAWREANPWGVLVEPPNELGRLRLLKRRAEELLHRAMRDFTALKQSLRGLAKNGSAGSADSIEKLKSLQRRVRSRNADVAEIEAEIDAHPDIVRRREVDSEQAERSADYLSEIESIEV